MTQHCWKQIFLAIIFQIKTLDEMRKVGKDLTKHSGGKKKEEIWLIWLSAKYTKYNN